MSELTEFQTLLLQKLKFRAVVPMSNELLQPPTELAFVEDFIRQQWPYLTADWTMPGKKTRKMLGWEDVPTSWWQTFKAEVFPEWLQRRFPPRTRRIETHIEIIKVCPGLGPWPATDHGHERFFAE